MAPVTQYVFAEMLGISEHFTAGSHEWLPYSDFSTFPKQYDKHKFVRFLFPFQKTSFILGQPAPTWGRLALWFMESGSDYIRGSMPSTGWPFSVSQFSSSSQSVVMVSSATISVKFSMP